MMPRDIRKYISLLEMANLPPEETGTKAFLHCGPKGGAKHSCRVKVSNTLGKMNPYDTFSIGVHDGKIYAGHCKLSSTILAGIRRWIFLNKDVIMKLWRSEISEREFYNQLKKI